MQVFMAVGAFEVSNPLIVDYLNKNGKNTDSFRDLAKWSGVLGILKDSREARYAILSAVFGTIPNSDQRHLLYTELGRIAKAIRELPAGAELIMV